MNLDTDFSSLISNPHFVQSRKLKRGGNKYDRIIGDDGDYNPEHIFKMFPKADEVLLFGADYYAEKLPNKNDGSWLVWDKRNGGENLDKMFGSQFELIWSKKRHRRELIRIQWAGIYGTEKEFDKKRHHPTQKPIALMSWLLNKFTSEGDIIIDLFGGSGSTLIACEQLNRTCYMIEIDPIYCDIIRKRYAKFIGAEEK